MNNLLDDRHEGEPFYLSRLSIPQGWCRSLHNLAMVQEV